MPTPTHQINVSTRLERGIARWIDSINLRNQIESDMPLLRVIRRDETGSPFRGLAPFASLSATVGTPAKLAAWLNKPSWFIIAANDRMIHPIWNVRKQTR